MIIGDCLFVDIVESNLCYGGPKTSTESASLQSVGCRGLVLSEFAF
jgi:hypothetical protein